MFLAVLDVKESFFMDSTGIAKIFVAATVNVLSTMAGIQPVAGRPFVKVDKAAHGDVTAIVGVVGACKGSIAVTFTKASAIAVVRAMLGDDVLDIIQDTKDTVGEVTNMISGQARAKLAEAGVPMQGSTPSIIFGDNHIVTHVTSAPVMAIPFTTEAGGFTVEFCLE